MTVWLFRVTIKIQLQKGGDCLIGFEIQKARKKLGITQKELAEKVGVSAPAIMRYEKGQREPSKEIIEKIAMALNISPTSLMNWDSWDEEKLSQEVQIIEHVQGIYGKDAVRLLEMFQKLNATGKEKALEDIGDLTELSKYTEKGETT